MLGKFRAWLKRRRGHPDSSRVRLLRKEGKQRRLLRINERFLMRSNALIRVFGQPLTLSCCIFLLMSLYASDASAQSKRPAGGRSGAPKTGAPTSRAKKTLVKIISNVKDAQVSMDGIAYGRVGSDMEISPGSTILTVSAPGYKSKSISIRVVVNTSSTYTVNLEKPAPKKPPTPKVTAASVAPSAKNNPRPASATKGSRPSKTPDLFADEPVDTFAPPASYGSSRVAPPPSVPQAVTPPPAPAQPVYPPGGYQQQPMYLAPQPMYPSPPPVYPQPMYQQPYMYPQPMYPQPPPYGGAYGPPPPPMAPGYSMDPGYSAPIDPYGGYTAPPLEPEPEMVAPPPLSSTEMTVKPDAIPPDRKRKSSRPPPMRPPPNLDSSSGKSRNKKTSSKGCSAFIKILPFGAGQFCNGSALKGLFFLGSEATSLYFLKINYDAANQYQKNLNTLLAERETERAKISSSDLAAYDEETAQKESAGNASIQKANQNALISIGIFAGAWALGVVDAFVNEPSTKSSKKRSKKMRFSVLPNAHDPTTYNLAMIKQESVHEVGDLHWYTSVQNSAGAKKQPMIVSLGFTLDIP